LHYGLENSEAGSRGLYEMRRNVRDFIQNSKRSPAADTAGDYVSYKQETIKSCFDTASSGNARILRHDSCNGEIHEIRNLDRAATGTLVTPRFIPL